MINSQSIAVHAFTWCRLKLVSVDEILLPRYATSSTNFRDLSLRVEMASSWLKYTRFVLLAVMSLAACSRLYSWDLAWAGVFVRTLQDITNI